MLPLLIRCLSLPVLRHAARAVRRVARRAVPGAGLPRAARRAALATQAVRLGGLACLMAPVLAPAPAMGPQDAPPRGVVERPGGREAGLGGTVGLAGADPVVLDPLPSPSGLMAAGASITGFETRTLAPEPAAAPAPRRVAVPEPASAGLFVTGVLALLWTQRRRRAASGLDGTGGRR